MEPNAQSPVSSTAKRIMLVVSYNPVSNYSAKVQPPEKHDDGIRRDVFSNGVRN